MNRLPILALVVTLAACDSSGGEGGPPGADTPWQGQHVFTLMRGASDNAEVARVVPGQPLALLVSSKARKVTLLRVLTDRLEVAREVALFENDPTESELTSLDPSPDGEWAVLTRTIIETDAGGAQTRCGGELVFLDVTDTDAFGRILAQVEVGPMPDAVAVSPDAALVVSANERDGPDAWGKCEVPGATPSVSVVDVSAGPGGAVERQRIEMIDADTGPREPEGVAFAKDSDLVFVTLQDSHEVAWFRASDVAALGAPTSADIHIASLPPDAVGAGPWPDGIARFENAAGVEAFATAGEWNDTFTVLATDGSVLSNAVIAERDIPAGLPRVVDEGSPLFSPDSVATFYTGKRPYVAFTLRHAGAVAIYDVADPTAPQFVQAIAVGEHETGKADEEGSTIRPEGIGAAADGSFLVVANEAESSVSLIRGR